jgi:hypothetical protein
MALAQVLMVSQVCQYAREKGRRALHALVSAVNKVVVFCLQEVILYQPRDIRILCRWYHHASREFGLEASSGTFALWG